MSNQMQVVNGGLDTVEVLLDRIYIEQELKLVRTILQDKTTHTADAKTKIVLKPNKELSTIEQVLECVIYTMDKLGCKAWKITRIDMSVDFKDSLEDNLNLGRLFLGCLAIAKRIRLEDIFNTKKGIEKQGNLKIKTRRLEVTIYNCNDKDRIANLRIEFKSKDIRNNLEDKEKVINEIKSILEDLKELETLVEKVEEYHIQELTNLYHKTIGKKYRTFSEFVAFADGQGYILTSEILKGLMLKVGLSIGYKKFVENFRKTRKETLKFVSKNDLKKFVKDLEKNLKIALKN